jgi:hypothetical protein
MLFLYQKEYLRLPDVGDLKAIVSLHQAKHHVSGMFGSLDCMHVFWKNCPVAWQGQYKGKEKKPSVVLEAICDHHLWFWHASFGYPGTLNDINIINLSPFLESLRNGTFAELKKKAEVVPYEIDGSPFEKLFVLTDGIYPYLSRFVKGKSQPIFDEEKTFSAWQESARKDIERGFGVLKGQFQVLARPMLGHSLKSLSSTMNCCLILHNMNVAERVMGGNVVTRYKPDYSIFEDTMVDTTVEYPQEFQQIVPPLTVGTTTVGIRQGSNACQQFLTRRKEWQELNDSYEHYRLQQALMRMKHNQLQYISTNDM